MQLYRIIRSLKYRTKCFWGMVHTHIPIVGNGVGHSTFRSAGVPIIKRSDDSRIVWGKNFRMNNGLAANQIGFNTPCIFRATHSSSVQ